jgi:hypothetical protein
VLDGWGNEVDLYQGGIGSTISLGQLRPLGEVKLDKLYKLGKVLDRYDHGTQSHIQVGRHYHQLAQVGHVH